MFKQTQGVSDEEKHAAQRQTLTADRPRRTRPKVTPLVAGRGRKQAMPASVAPGRPVAGMVIPSPSEPMKVQKAQVHYLRRGAVRKQQGRAGCPVRPAPGGVKVSVLHPGLREHSHSNMAQWASCMLN